MTASRSKVLVVVGPTASGKSAVAEAVAERICAELVSADSMQIYRGMDVATDKPDAGRRAKYRYHMLDVADPGEPFTVVRYREMARDSITSIQRAGNLPIVVGGSGLYVRAVIDDLDFPPPESGRIAEGIRRDLECLSSDELYAKLLAIDPAAAEAVHRNNRRRLVRALEFIAETGRPFSDLQRRWTSRPALYDVRIFGLRRPRGDLYRAVEDRVDAMVETGLVEEARRIAALAGSEGTSRQALGYKELAGYLVGKETLEDATRRLKRATRRYAKRQMTWFGRDRRVVWIDAVDLRPEQIAARIVADLQGDGWLEPNFLRVEGG